MRAIRIFLAGLIVACSSMAVSAQSALFGTKPVSTAPQSGTMPPMSALVPPPGAVPPDLLTSPPSGLPNQPIPGAAYSPWCGDRLPGDFGVGGNGPITYETYFRTGPNIIADAGGFNGALERSGWVAQFGGRSLLFNQAGDAAWVIDLGLSTTYNRGTRLSNPIQVLANSLKSSDPSNDFTIPLGVRRVNRTSFNYGIGRDWFLNGPGYLDQAPETNWRFGTDFGGRYGTASVGFEPQGDPDGYRRRQKIYHGIYVGTHLNWERNFGGWILLAGVRAEYGYTWTNLIPPLDGDIQDVNLMLTFGVRF